MTKADKERKIGVVGVPGGWSSERLADAVAERTGFRRLIDLGRVSMDLGEGKVHDGDFDLTQLDAIIVKKLGPSYRPELLDRLEILQYLSGRGVRVFSKPTSIMRVLDRLSCTVTLQTGGIPMPPTTVTEDVDQAAEIVRRYGKAILKPLFTSKARGMVMLDAKDDVERQIAAFKAAGNPVIYIQQMVPIPGNDLGIVFLGGKYLATYARHADTAAWNTTTHNGGEYRACEPSPALIELADRAQRLFDLDFTCVDIVEAPGGPLVFEVSAFGGFRGLLAANGIDAAREYTDYVLGKLNHD